MLFFWRTIKQLYFWIICFCIYAISTHWCPYTEYYYYNILSDLWIHSIQLFLFYKFSFLPKLVFIYCFVRLEVKACFVPLPHVCTYLAASSSFISIQFAENFFNINWHDLPVIVFLFWQHYYRRVDKTFLKGYAHIM